MICRCGKPATLGKKSCTPCRVKDAERNQNYRLNGGLRRMKILEYYRRIGVKVQ